MPTNCKSFAHAKCRVTAVMRSVGSAPPSVVNDRGFLSMQQLLTFMFAAF
jgi:hypothetical protein